MDDQRKDPLEVVKALLALGATRVRVGDIEAEFGPARPAAAPAGPRSPHEIFAEMLDMPGDDPAEALWDHVGGPPPRRDEA